MYGYGGRILRGLIKSEERGESMVFVTGDTHGQIDYLKLERFACKNTQLTKKDYVIIAGDFGAIWDKRTLEKDLDMYSKLPWTTLFVDGNHENFDIINSYPVEMWNGGKVHKIRKDIIHLMRGQIFEIEGKKIFTFGGAMSIDKAYRLEGLSWWRQELPTYDDLEEASVNLAKRERKVDYIITHSCSERTLYRLPLYDRPAKFKPCLDNAFLSNFETVKYKHWYFGHYHIDEQISDNQTALYQDIVELK